MSLFPLQVEVGELAHRQMQELGMKDDTNLFEMAGCLLRLVMWPTGMVCLSVMCG